MSPITLDASTRILHRDNLDYAYTAEDFVNPESFDCIYTKDAYVITGAGQVLAIVFQEYQGYCEQDALDAAVDSDKLDSLLITDAELPDYQTATDEEGNPEYCGVINLGNAGEPFDVDNLDIFRVPAVIFATDAVIVAKIAEREA